MQIRTALTFLVCLAALLTASRQAQGSPASHKLRNANLVFIQLDTVRADYVDGATMPTLTRLASKGIAFTRALSTSTWCVPGTVSLLTALGPSRHGVYNKFVFTPGDATGPHELKLSRAVKTLPEVLRAHGYSAAAFTGQQTIDSIDGLDKRLDLHFTGERLCTFEKTGPAALAWIKTQKKPFFAFVHAYNPHGAVDMPYTGQFFSGRYRGPYRPGAAQYLKMRDQEWLNKEREGRFFVSGMGKDDVAYMRALYRERLRHTDQQLGAFMKGLAAAGVLDKTIVVITSDHGEELFERDAMCHGHSLYDELIHVPLVFLFPGASSQKVTTAVRNIDALPTMLDAVGVQAPEGRDGVSLLPVIEGHAVARIDYPETDFLKMTTRRGVVDGRYKLVVTIENGTQELYDLEKDPGERVNLRTQMPYVAARLYGKLKKRFTTLP